MWGTLLFVVGVWVGRALLEVTWSGGTFFFWGGGGLVEAEDEVTADPITRRMISIKSGVGRCLMIAQGLGLVVRSPSLLPCHQMSMQP